MTPTPTSTISPEGYLKVCKVAGPGISVGQIFEFNVDGRSVRVVAGYCEFVGTYATGTFVTIQEVVPAGTQVSAIDVNPPGNTVSTNIGGGQATASVGPGTTEVSFTNRTLRRFRQNQYPDGVFEP